jgi:hypothetical protein
VNATYETPDDARIAAMVRCIWSPPRDRAAAPPTLVAVSFAPSAWYAIAGARDELDAAGRRLRTTLAALGRWFLDAV